MKTSHFIILGALSVAGFFIAKYLVNKFEGEEEYLGNLSRKDIEALYSKVKL